jgi:hypothetical protein
MTSVGTTNPRQGLSLLMPLLLDRTPFIFALPGDTSYKHKAREALIVLPLPRQAIGDGTLAGKLNQANEALLFFSPWEGHSLGVRVRSEPADGEVSRIDETCGFVGWEFRIAVAQDTKSGMKGSPDLTSFWLG